MDNKSIMLYDNQKKSVFLAYLLGGLLGWLGLHLYYIRDNVGGTVRLGLWLLSLIHPAFIFLFGLAMLYDLFATYFAVKAYNKNLIEELSK
jgi:hypothetical protein